MLKKDEMPESLRNRIWNVFYYRIFKRLDDMVNKWTPPWTYVFIKEIWSRIFKDDIAIIEQYAGPISRIKYFLSHCKWFEVYDFIELFAVSYEEDIERGKILNELNDVFIEEKTFYRIINNILVPLTSEEEIAEIEKVLNISYKFKPISDHLSKALEYFSKRPESDNANSIKESISAVESLVQIILGEKGTLSDLINKLNVHPAMKKGFEKLYSWTSDDSGIRHGEFGESFPCDESEARYMLVTCSAFLNYVMAKLSAGNNFRL